MLIFNRDDIKRETDAGSYQRGLDYFNQGLVLELEITHTDNNRIKLISEVNGNNFYPYSQAITLYKHHQNLTLDGECSCPVAYNCKHVVASCLEYLSRTNRQQIDPKEETNSLVWLDDFITAGSTDTQPVSLDEFICYVLKPSTNTGEITVEFSKHRRLKNGGIGKGKSINLYGMSDNYIHTNYIRKIDTEIAKIVEVQNKNNWMSSNISLFGEIGCMCFLKMIATEHCYWQTTENPPLKITDTRELKLKWHNKKNNDKQLKIEIEPDAIPLNFHPPFYLDTVNHEAGKLSGADFTEQQWKMLLNMPPIDADTCKKFTRQLHISYPDSPIPAPEKIKKININKPTIPQILLFVDTDINTGNRTHFIRLRFHYGKHEVKTFPRATTHNIEHGDSIVSIKRDLKKEQYFEEKLKNNGFSALPDSQLEDNLFYFSSDNGELSETIHQWENFIENTLPQLEATDWKIDFDPAFQLNFLQIDSWDIEIESESDNDWFELRFDLDINNKKIPLLPLMTEVLNNYDIKDLPKDLILPLSNHIDNSEYIKIPSQRILPIIQTLYELFDRSSQTNKTLKLSRFDAAKLAELEDSSNNALNWTGGKAMRQLGRKLKNFHGIKKVAPPRGLKATLRDYQQQGLNWLQFLREYNFNGILADDMGLGKTVQTLAMLLKEKESRRLTKPCLILAPTSLMSNWKNEARIFTPKLKVLVLQGPERKQHFDSIKDHDIILSTYPLLVRDKEILLSHEYHYLILDEAQVIKNPLAKAARVARDINAQHRLCLTGTPMENHLGELWALFDFLMPGCLGDKKIFKKLFRIPIEKHNNLEQRERLTNRVAPFMLRRTKAEVAKELPNKTEIIRSVSLGKSQAALYESIRLSMEKKVKDAINQKGLSRSHITILDALLKLRQTCCDPKLLSIPQASKVKASAKLEMLMEMLPELIEEGRRILIFSQFTKMLSIIEDELNKKNISYTKLTGKTINREKVINQFKQGKADVFLISLKAGGVGLNLTEADTVIHYDPWWNPAAENQATDRAHRIGQDKAVFVYKLITENTLEEKIMQMQEKKQALADGIYNKEGTTKNTKLTSDDLQELFAPLT